MASRAEILAEWQRRAGAGYEAHFQKARPYLGQTVDEIASDEAAWTISDYQGHPVLLLAGTEAFALVAFSGSPEGVTIKGALHPLDEGVIRVSFSDQLDPEEIDLDGIERFQPMVRRWAFDWHGRLQLPIAHWLPRQWPPEAVAVIASEVGHQERQRAMAHKLAMAAGWPMPAEGEPTPP
jgi:hypothetical protein